MYVVIFTIIPHYVQTLFDFFSSSNTKGLCENSCRDSPDVALTVKENHSKANSTRKYVNMRNMTFQNKAHYADFVGECVVCPVCACGGRK